MPVDIPWLSALAHAQRRMGFKHGTALLVSDDLVSSVSWGIMRPVILLKLFAFIMSTPPVAAALPSVGWPVT